MKTFCLAAVAALLLAGCAEAPPPAAPVADGGVAETPAPGCSIAVPAFAAADAAFHDLGQRVAAVIAADLCRGGRFAGPVLRPEGLPAPDLTNPAAMAAWSEAGAAAVLLGKAGAAPPAAQADGDAFRIEVRLLDVAKRRFRLTRAYTAPEDGWRRVAHQIADETQKMLTGVDGAWDTRIAYIAETATGGRRLAVMDHDGANHLLLTPVLTGLRDLRATGTADEIAFSAHTAEGPARFHMMLASAQRQYAPPAAAVGEVPSPDDTLTAFVRDGALWVRARHGDMERALARAVSQTSLAWAPNGRKIAFVRATPAGPRLFAVDVETGVEYAIPTPGNAVEVAWLRFP